MTQALVLDTNSHRFQLENVSHANGPNQVQVNSAQNRFDADQLDLLVLEQLKALTQKIVDTAALTQIQASHSSEKHDAHGSHEKAGSSPVDFSGVIGAASK